MTDNEKVTYVFKNVLNKHFSDKAFAKFIEHFYSAYYIYVTNDTKKKKLVICGKLKGEKGKVLCLIDSEVAQVLPPSLIEYAIINGFGLIIQLNDIIENFLSIFRRYSGGVIDTNQ